MRKYVRSTLNRFGPWATGTTISARAVRHRRLFVAGLFLFLAPIGIALVPGTPIGLDDPFLWGTLAFVAIGLSLALSISGSRKLREIGSEIRSINDVLDSPVSVRTKELASLEPSFDEHRRLRSILGSWTDDADADVREMRRLAEMRTTFLANVSHELRTPVFSIQGFLETLIDGAIDDPEVRDEFLSTALENVVRLTSLLDDLIEISRIESGELRPSFREFDVVEASRATIAVLSERAKRFGISLGLVLSGEDAEGKILAYGDRKKIEQVLVNLVENAIKYNRRGGSAFLRLYGTGNEATIVVEDQGEGIAPDLHGRIFERFYRVDANRSRAVGGTGLGLAIVKHIVESHGSTVRLESSPGVGSKFSISLRRLPE